MSEHMAERIAKALEHIARLIDSPIVREPVDYPSPSDTTGAHIGKEP